MDYLDLRQNIFDQISRNEDVGEFYRLLSVMEQAFGDPFQVTMKQVDDDADGAADNEDEPGAQPKDEHDADANDELKDKTNDDLPPEQKAVQSTQDAYKAKLFERKGDTIIKRKKIQLFKFWPKHVLRQGWLKYVLAATETAENVNAAFLAVLLLDKVTQQFVLHCIEKQHKK